MDSLSSEADVLGRMRERGMVFSVMVLTGKSQAREETGGTVSDKILLEFREQFTNN